MPEKNTEPMPRYRFDRCELDTDRRELIVAGTPREIEPQVFDLLAYLAERGDIVVSRDELVTHVWKGRIVSDSAIGYAEAAMAHWAAVFYGLSDEPARSLEKAVALAEKAIELDDVTGYPHLVLAQVHLRNRNFDQARAEADNAVSDRPSCPAAFAIKAIVLNYLGDYEDAVAHARHAVRLSPVHPLLFPAVLASAYHGAGRNQEAIVAAQGAIELEQDKAEPYLILAASAVVLGHLDEARHAAHCVLALKPGFKLDAFADSQSFKDREYLDRLLDQLRTAGLE